MEQRQQKSALVLKYAKRRFDGGNEVDLIRAIERQQDVSQLNKVYQHGTNETVNPGFSAPMNLSLVTPVAVNKTEVAQKPVSNQNRKVWETVIKGPLQICIGLVGILTAGLAIWTFRRFNNQPMLEQSKVVFADCVKTLGKGLLDTAVSPVRVLKALVSKG